MPQFDNGPFISNTAVFDEETIRSVDVKSDKFKDLWVLLTRKVNDISILLNQKSHGVYSLTHYPSGNQLFPVTPTDNNRGSIRATYFLAALPAAPGIAPIAHGITYTTSTLIWYSHCQANDPDAVAPLPRSFPIPAVASTQTSTTAFWIDATNINIEVTADLSAYSAIIVLEYTI